MDHNGHNFHQGAASFRLMSAVLISATLVVRGEPILVKNPIVSGKLPPVSRS